MNSTNYGRNSGVETGKGAVFITVVALALSLTLPLYGQQTAKDVSTDASGSPDQQASGGTQQTRQGIVQQLDGMKQSAAVAEEAAESAPATTQGSGELAAFIPSGAPQTDPQVAATSNPDPQ